MHCKPQSVALFPKIVLMSTGKHPLSAHSKYGLFPAYGCRSLWAVFKNGSVELLESGLINLDKAIGKDSLSGKSPVKTVNTYYGLTYRYYQDIFETSGPS